MTGPLAINTAALLIWALGIAPTAVYITRRLNFLERADPLLLCDYCRYHRRGLMTILSPIRELYPAMLPMIIVVVGATWPVVGPMRCWRVARRVQRGGPLRHSCDYTRQAVREAVRG